MRNNVVAVAIPARFQIGFPLPANKHSAEIPGYHCWAEFYLDSVGWVRDLPHNF
jgi:transglutaminase-like putative cysteine protease